MHQIRVGPPMTTSTVAELLFLAGVASLRLPGVAAAGDNGQNAVPDALIGVPVAIAARASSSNDCPANYYSCASQGSQFDEICCPYDQVCSLTTDGRPACCPSGDVCTGSAPSTYVTTTAAASYVPNSYFSFPYLLPAGVVATTALADANACDAVLDQCSQTFSQCTSELENGGGGTNNVDSGGVTIVISGSTTFTRGAAEATGGVQNKRDVTTTLAAASAASVCSSLSSQACGGLPTNAAGCSSLFAQATGFSSGNAGTQQRHLPSLIQVVGVATAAGAASLMMF